MPTVNVSASFAPAIRVGANITAAAVQTVFARGGLYRRIVAGTLTQNIRLRLSPDGAVVGSPIVIIREDVEAFSVTIEDWAGAVLSVLPANQQWTAWFERGASAWFKVGEGQPT